MSESLEFAVVDVETTGLFAGGTDRIIEIAILRLNGRGEVINEYASLVNPHRDLGPTHIHGIRARDVAHAPRFEEIAGDVTQLLTSAIFVSHNVSFDARFVRAEMERLGHAVPDFPTLCTLHLSRRIEPLLPSRRLVEICRHLGIAVGTTHSARDDARAAAALLKACSARLGGLPPADPAQLGVRRPEGDTSFWPVLPVSGRSYSRQTARDEASGERSYIERLVARLPASSDSSPEIDDYCALLDRALEDRRITEEESEALASLARESGLSCAAVVDAHLGYMRDLIRVALEDGIITEAERRDLDDVRRLLAITEDRFEALLKDTPANTPPAVRSSATQLAGKTVCFTGTLLCRINGEQAKRSDAHRAAAACGMEIRKSVTKNLDYLVVADPDSMSGKARKAHAYGVRILAEPVFWRLAGVDVE